MSLNKYVKLYSIFFYNQIDDWGIVVWDLDGHLKIINLIELC